MIKIHGYKLGTSLKDLLLICLPLMFAELSVGLMTFFNRLILSNYSLEAMNASIAASTPYSIFYFAAISVASITGIYVGKYYGAREFIKIGEYVWQILWFSLFITIIFTIIAPTIADIVIPISYKKLGTPYFKILMSFTGFTSANVALAAFYISRGKVKLVIFSVILANIINIILNILLVFGVGAIIPPFSTTGSAISSVIAHICQFTILFAAYLSHYNKRHFRTENWRFKFDVLKRGLVTAFPGFVGTIIEMLAWAIFVYFTAITSIEYMVIYSIGDSIFTLFAFIIDGLYKGISTIAATLIGAGRVNQIRNLLFSSIKLVFCLSVLLSIPLIFQSDFFIKLFIQEENNLTLLNHSIKAALFWIWIYFIFGNILWILVGILIAFNDTIFTAGVNSITVWICAVVPSLICVMLQQGSSYIVWQFYVLYAIVTSLVIYFRYLKLINRYQEVGS